MQAEYIEDLARGKLLVLSQPLSGLRFVKHPFLYLGAGPIH